MKKLQAILSLVLLTASMFASLVPNALASDGPRTPDSDNTFDTATPISSGGTASGDVASDDRSDYYVISDVLAGQTIKASFTYSNSSATIRMYLCSTWGGQLLGVTTGIGTVRGDTTLAPYNGSYYIQIRADNGLSDYTLTVTVGYPADLVPGVQSTGSLNSQTDARTDWYRIRLDGNSGGTAEAVWINMTKSNPAASVDRRLYDDLDYYAIHPYNESWSYNQRTNVTAAATYWGWYYYRISCTGQSSGYTLDCGKYSMGVENDNDYLNSTPVPKNGNATGSVDKAFDHYDWYAYDVKANDNIQVFTQRGTANTVFNVSVFSSNMTFLIGGDNSAIGWYGSHDSWVNITAPAASSDETYYVVVMVDWAHGGYGGQLNDNPVTMAYNITFLSPDHPPQIKLPFAPVSITEDERYKVNIYDHFFDPDGDPLAVKVTGQHILGSYCATSGDLEIYGAWNWVGNEIIMIMATDPLNMQTGAPLNVTVTWVEHAPYLKKPIPDVYMAQNSVNEQLDLSQYIVDNDTAYADRLSFGALANGSIWVNITPAGKVSLTAPISFWGTVNMTFTAIDNSAMTVSAPCRVIVAHVNQPPQVRGNPPPIEVNENDQVTVDLTPYFWDPDGDTISLTPSNNVRIDVAVQPGDLNLTFKPQPDIGDFSESITLTAKDNFGLGANFAVINVNVAHVNQAPRITTVSPPANVTLTETDILDFSVLATDIENGSAMDYTWYLDDAQVAAGNPAFTYRTDYFSAGTHLLKLVVSDGELSTVKIWNVTVKNLNREPNKVTIVNPKPGATFKEGTVIEFDGSAADPDGDQLDYRWLEGVMALGTGQNFSTVLAIGVHKITLEVSDGFAAVKSSVVSVTVRANSRPSLISYTPSDGQKFQKGKVIRFSVEALDADNDTLSYCWTENNKVIGTAAEFSLSNLAPGQHRLHLTVSDGMAMTDAYVNIAVNEPQSGGPDMMMVGILAGVVVIIALLAGVAVLRRRGKKPRPLAGPQLEQPPLEQPKLEW
jgi:hypothetical protein